MRDIVSKHELDKASIEEISRRSRHYDNSSLMKPPILEQLGYDRMTDFGVQIILVTYMGQYRGNLFTGTFIRQLKYMSGKVPDKDPPSLRKTIPRRPGKS